MPRILIVDDEEEFRKLLRAILEKAGHEVLDAPDAQRGYALYRENLIDLLIVDLVMPKVSGAALIYKLRHDSSDTKIIAISGGGPRGEFDFLAAARVLGAHRTFLKPFKHNELLAAIKALVPI
ncbi:MAG TPA: response regulator [Nitrospiraceae bacterium]|jgi:two-component system response regulator PhoP|nr:response regulator [Nitrospiraceae bacterium]